MDRQAAVRRVAQQMWHPMRGGLTHMNEMTTSQYVEYAMRTQADQEKIRQRIYDLGVVATTLDMASRGLCDDCGEVNGCIKKWLEYGQELDVTNLIEELGDVLYRIAQICNALNIPLDVVLKANIKKLSLRYPNGFSDFLAAEANRDRDGERKVIETEKPVATMYDAKVPTPQEKLEQTGQGWAEPPEDMETEPRLPNNNYDRFCKVCKRTRVHNMNQSQVCPNCAALARANEKGSL